METNTNNWRLVSDSVPSPGYAVVYKPMLKSVYVGMMDATGSYLTGSTLPEGYLSLFPDDKWLPIPSPEHETG